MRPRFAIRWSRLTEALALLASALAALAVAVRLV